MVSKKFLKIVVVLLAMALGAVIAVGVYLIVVFYQSTTGSEAQYNNSTEDVCSPPYPSNSTLGVFSEAAVVSLGSPCAEIGKSMLDAGGNVVDAVIASLLCDGVCVMQSMGIGGGFIMTLYNKSEGKAYSLISRETAPGAATQDMFVNASSTYGALSAGVPGELKGYQAMHERFGKLAWSDLFQPTIQLCEEGVPVNARLAANFLASEEALRNSSTFMSVILNSTGGEFPKEGDVLKLPLLANTLRLIAESPNKAEELYNGNLTAQFVADIQAGGGIITEQDMINFTVRWEEPYNASVSGNYTIYSSALPGSGILVTYMLRLLDGLLQFADSDIERSLYIIEAFKYAYGRRSGLGDPHFLNETYIDEVISLLTNDTEIESVRGKIKLGWTSNNASYYGASYTSEDSGTDNNVAVDAEGNAISVTSTINLLFGSKFVSTSTGIILNDEMDDFSTPGVTNSFGVEPSKYNYIEPGKRPLSSMSPTVVLDSEGDVRLVVGGAGGTLITTQVTSVILKNLWEGKNIKESIDERRFHHQLSPMYVLYEYGITKDMVNAWQEAGHVTVRTDESLLLAVITGIARLGDSLTANCDWRKPGSVAGV